MRLAAIACGVGISFCTPAAAAEWWWIGTNGDAPRRILTYFDQETVRMTGGGKSEVWTLSVGESASLSGQQHQATLYGIDCRARRFSTLKRVAIDGNGKAMDFADPPPTAFAKVIKGSIGESVLDFACGKPAGHELKVPNAFQHAVSYFFGATQAAPGTQQSAAEQTQTSGGTGFFVSGNGDMVTSYHVVDGAKKIVVFLPDGTSLPATVVKASAATDLAVLRINRSTPQYLTLGAAGRSKPGDRVFTFGFPVLDLLGAEPKFTDGAISSLSGIGNEAAFAQISVPIQPGNSGGPLVNERGEVVGVIAAAAAIEPFMETAGTLPQNVNWAVRAEYLAPLIQPGKRAPASSRDDAVALARNAVALVVVQR